LLRHRAAIFAAVCAALILLLAPSRAWAHPVPFSYLDVRVELDRIDASVIVHIFDAGHDLNLDEPERLLDAGYLASRARDIVALLAPRLLLRVDGHAASPEWSAAIEALPDRQSIRLHVRYALRSRPGQVSVTARLFPYDPEHRTFVNIYEGDHLTQAILEPAHPDFEYFAGTRQGVVAVIKKFLVAGIHHILIGPDHLLFLVGLLLLGGSIGRLASIVTAFTIAHSVTLTLAALNLFSPPARLIEPAIALSIVCVGADNLLVSRQPGSRDLRAAMAFAFGFIHGFGFASVLREMDLPGRALGWSLFSFNAGVEIGQLLVVIPVATALSLLWARSETAGRRLAWAGSVVVVAAGLFWFAQRVFFWGGSV
jgi:hydrogenase/urease accessory protein HupE